MALPVGELDPTGDSRPLDYYVSSRFNGIQKWADENGFQFSQSKTVCTHFTQLRSANADPDLKLYGASIPVVNEFKFLGLIFDKKLTFKQHIRYLQDRCFKALNLLRLSLTRIGEQIVRLC